MSDLLHDIPNQLALDPETKQASWTAREWVWALPQPMLVLGTTILVAAMVASDWANRELFAAIMMVLPIPLMIVAERIWTKRTDWLLEPKEMIEDVGWIAAGTSSGSRCTATTTKPPFLKVSKPYGICHR